MYIIFNNKKHPVINSHQVLNLHLMDVEIFFSHVKCMAVGSSAHEENTQHTFSMEQ
jgi:hypothetical protein